MEKVVVMHLAVKAEDKQRTRQEKKEDRLV